MPEIEGGMHYIDYLFKVGPVSSESAISWQELGAWLDRAGPPLEPWECELLIDLSKEYFRSMHDSKPVSAIPPWPRARKMWKYVCDQRNMPILQQALDEPLEKKDSNVNRKRRRNPPSG